jgi:glycosyltransferase involved in cell wall biosynthesis
MGETGASPARPSPARPRPARPYRIAWLASSLGGDHGVPYMAIQLLTALDASGVEIDCFTSSRPPELPAELSTATGIRFFSGFEFSRRRWYRRMRLSRYVGDRIAAVSAKYRLVDAIADRHGDRPYDAVYQFSQIEMLGLRRRIRRLPPVIIHAEVHAAGELRWLRRERGLARQCEPALARWSAEVMQLVRVLVQHRDIQLARLVVAPSRRFAMQLSEDYRYPSDRIRVVPNPVSLERFRPRSSWPVNRPTGPLKLVFASRISVRKGVEMVVALSHRLADLAGQVEILVVGTRTDWSDYRPLLDRLEPAVATYRGKVANSEIAELYRSSDALLQPSHYEPFALTVAEALASGIPVVVSDEVGAAGFIDPSSNCCRVFPAGDLDAFEATVRAIVADLQAGQGETLAAGARLLAEQWFSPSVVAGKIVECIGELREAREGGGAAGVRPTEQQDRDGSDVPHPPPPPPPPSPPVASWPT